MSLTINQNLMAQNAARNLTQHYDGLSTSVNRLSSGLRINSAADDAAGLAIRELMRAEVASMKQGVRNANDAISMIQVADGALQIIDEKLIRMKELATQAATGTYNSDQRLIIDSEYQQMASEIQRIAQSTKFNGVYLLNGNLSGSHNGIEIKSQGMAKIHFGTGNNEKEDYYYINIQAVDLINLGLAKGIPPRDELPLIDDILNNGILQRAMPSGLQFVAMIPQDSRNFSIVMDGIIGAEDDIQIFTRDGKHLVGTNLTDYSWVNHGVTDATIDSIFINEDNGFISGAIYDPSQLFDGRTIAFNNTPPYNLNNNYNPEMNFGYSGDGDLDNSGSITSGDTKEYLTIDNVTEDLLLFVTGFGIYDITASWESLGRSHIPYSDFEIFDIKTQENAQTMLEVLDESIVYKDNIRSSLGAMQNRLANTITNLSIQAENLMAAESRVSDADIALEMTAFVRNQILTQSAVAMLAQANSLPRMAMQVIQG